ncbi:hypothetical protein M405DRAFT_840305 [Rhizopogon salebrosus TDB-379]|nr:hypothetical protein M405DRAFT_840305 [Rhizopogon salebrosus TDB-379]
MRRQGMRKKSSVYDYLEAEFQRDYAFFVYPSAIDEIERQRPYMQRRKTVATSGWDIASEEREMEGNESSKEYFKLLPGGYTKRHSLDKIALALGSTVPQGKLVVIQYHITKVYSSEARLKEHAWHTVDMALQQNKNHHTDLTCAIIVWFLDVVAMRGI